MPARRSRALRSAAVNAWRDLPRRARCVPRRRPRGAPRRLGRPRRDHGGLIFVDLRDAQGRLQLVFNPRATLPRRAEVAHELRNEFVLRAAGEVVARSPETVNPDAGRRGEIEVQVDELEILSRSTPLPFQLDEEDVDETLRLTLPLARPAPRRRCSATSALRAQARRDRPRARWTRTASSTSRRRSCKPTPEGARDFLVPSRLQPDRFYALPQSPADLQADPHDRRLRPLLPDRPLLPRRGSARRPPAGAHARSTSRLSFLDRRDLFAAARGLMRRIFDGVRQGAELARRSRASPTTRPMLRYGSDKPDLRFGLEIEDATEVTRGSGFKVFADARRGALPARATRALARRAREARGGREAVGRQGARLPRLRSRWRGSLADRQVPGRGRARAFPRRARAHGPLRRRRAGDGLARARRAAPAPRARARVDRHQTPGGSCG